MSTVTIGTIKEIKDNENRVGLTPHGVQQLIADGHKVLVQTGAGTGAGFSDQEYHDAGAELLPSPEEVVKKIDILVKVKEPLQEEYPLLKLMRGKTLYTYLHLSGVDPELTTHLLNEKITGVAYETVQDEHGGLPLLKPMSEIAGVLAVQYGGEYLQKKYHGRGTTLGEITGVDRSHVVVIGAGVVGLKSAQTAAGMGSKVTLFDIRKEVLQRAEEHLHQYLGSHLMSHVTLTHSSPESVSKALETADLLIGAVLIPGKKAPNVVNAAQIAAMRPGSVVIDVAIDQGGCIEGAHATTHSDPIYMVGGKIFSCVANMPGQVAYQSTQALTNATLPYLRLMAKAASALEAMKQDPGFLRGLNTYDGKITFKAVAEDLDRQSDFQEIAL